MEIQTAQIIWEQLKDSVTWSVLGSWGISQRMALTKGSECYGLRLKVNGRKHKGYVAITLEPSDTYSVQLLSVRGLPKQKLNDVYCEDLGQIIDGLIED